MESKSEKLLFPAAMGLSVINRLLSWITFRSDNIRFNKIVLRFYFKYNLTGMQGKGLYLMFGVFQIVVY